MAAPALLLSLVTLVSVEAAAYKQEQYVVSGCLDPPLTDAACEQLFRLSQPLLRNLACR